MIKVLSIPRREEIILAKSIKAELPYRVISFKRHADDSKLSNGDIYE